MTHVVLAERKDRDKIRSTSNRELDEPFPTFEGEVGCSRVGREGLGGSTDDDGKGGTGTCAERRR